MYLNTISMINVSLGYIENALTQCPGQDIVSLKQCCRDGLRLAPGSRSRLARTH